MSRSLQILAVEDDPMDAVMVNHVLSKNRLDFKFKRVETEEEFRRELDHNPPDIILSDHGLPTFSGITALAIARETCPETPFIFVTGRSEHDLALHAVTEGVTGCISKDRLSELGAMIREAGKSAQLRRWGRFWARVGRRLKRLFGN